LNAAAALYVAGNVPALGEGLERAREVMRTGSPLERLETLAQASAKDTRDG
jgi:anthranilate phosphoribosyltransferase